MEPRYGNEQGLIINGHEKYFWGDKNVLKVVYGDDYTTNDGKVANGWTLRYVEYTSIKLLTRKKRKIRLSTASST